VLKKIFTTAGKILLAPVFIPAFMVIGFVLLLHMWFSEKSYHEITEESNGKK
jgi:hypothetical protein